MSGTPRPDDASDDGQGRAGPADPPGADGTAGDAGSDRHIGDRPVEDDDAGVDRREFMRTALSVGTAGALSSAVNLFGTPDVAGADGDGDGTGAAGRGAGDGADGPTVAERANRQHAWNAYERRAHGTFLPPEHHLILLADYDGAGDGTPTAAERRTAREAFDRLERAFEWRHDGLLFVVGYSTTYFERYDAALPRGLRTDNGAIPRMLTARQLIDGPTVPIIDPESPDLQPTEPEGEEDRRVDLQVTLEREAPVADDDHDVCIHLASDDARKLMLAERALWGERESVGGVSFSEANLAGVLTRPTEYPERRTGFVGTENLRDRVDVGEAGSTAAERFAETVADGADLSMGYDDLYRNSMPREDNVTMLEDQRFLPGPPNWQPPAQFANGTIMHVSHLDSDLEGWYGENDETERRHRMFSPHHTEADVGEVGENLAPRESNAPVADSKPDAERLPMRDVSAGVRDVAERTQADFEAGRPIGHAQKTARTRAQLEAHFRNEDGGPPLSVPQRDDPVAAERDDDLAGQDDTDQTVETGFLRRDFNTVDDGGPGTHFVALQAFSIYLAYVRHAMNNVSWDTAAIAQPSTPDGTAGFEHDADDGENPDHGILEYLTTRRRGNFVVPPIRQRALPHPDAVELVEDGVAPETGLGGAPLPPYVDPDGSFEFARVDDRYLVRIPDADLADRIDPGSVRFGFYRAVNAGGGAEPVAVRTAGADAGSGDGSGSGGDGDGGDAAGGDAGGGNAGEGGVAFLFAVSDTRLPEALDREAADAERPDDATVRARLYAEREDGKPVFGTTTVAADREAPDSLAAFYRGDDGEVDLGEVLEGVTGFNTDGVEGYGSVSLDDVLELVTAYDS